ncbi:MAG: LamG-like jellyroll fold domain-containing protein, partial [Lentisphaeria bacterium]|nr:LamG-like jellyroll fold domain-containing protein [Lentisphaeria bacterium]
RYQSSTYRVETVTNDVLSNQVSLGTQLTPESALQNAIGINVSYPDSPEVMQDRMLLRRLRVYFDSDEHNQLNPNWVLNPLDGSANSGLQLRRGDGTLLPTQPTEWKSDYEYGYVPYNEELEVSRDPDNKLSAGTVLKWFVRDDNLIWYDGDNDGVWSAGDALWINGGADVNYDFYDETKNLLAGQAPLGAYGKRVSGSTFGFAYYDVNGDDSYDLGDDIYFLGSGRNTLGYFADLRLSSPASLPASSGASPDFYVSVLGNRDPQIFGLLQFKLSLLSTGLIYGNADGSSLEHSYASSDVTTNLLTYKVQPGAIRNFLARRGMDQITLSWELPETPYDKVMIIRSEKPLAADPALMYYPDAYPTMKRYYSARRGSGEDYNTLKKYEYATSVSNPGDIDSDDEYKPDDIFEQADDFYILEKDGSGNHVPGNSKVVYIGKGDSEYIDFDVQEGYTYYYMAFAGAVTNGREQGTPNAVTPTNDKPVTNSQKFNVVRDQMIEAYGGWGVVLTNDDRRPADVTNLRISLDDKKLTLYWDVPTHNADQSTPFDGDIIIVRSKGATVNGLPNDGQTYAVDDPFGTNAKVVAVLSNADPGWDGLGYVDEPLDNGEDYYYAVYALDGNLEHNGNYSENPATANARPSQDAIPDNRPETINLLSGMSEEDGDGGYTVKLTWSWPKDGMVDVVSPVMILRSERSFNPANLGHYLKDGQAYQADDTVYSWKELQGGVEVEVARIVVLSGYNGDSANFTDTAVVSGKTYYYAVVSYHAGGLLYNPWWNAQSNSAGQAYVQGENYCSVKIGTGTVSLDGYSEDDPDDDGISSPREYSNDDIVVNLYDGGQESYHSTDWRTPYSPWVNRILDLTANKAHAKVEDYDYALNDNGEPLSIELWYKLGSGNSGAFVQKTAHPGPNGIDEFGQPVPALPRLGDFWFGLKDGKLSFKFRNRGTVVTWNGREAFQDAHTVVTFDELDLSGFKDSWIHAAVVLSPDSNDPNNFSQVSFVVQVEGFQYSLTKQVAGSRAVENNPGNLLMGENPDASDGHLNMYIDEVRLWNTARSLEQIADNRNTLNFNTDDMASWYSFDDGGYTAEDRLRSFAGHESLEAIPAINILAAAKMSGAEMVAVASSKYGDETFSYLSADSDNDQIPDFWEHKYFSGLNTAGVNAAGRNSADGTLWWTDSSADGVNDYYVFLMGYNPLEYQGDKLSEVLPSGLTLAQAQYWRVNPNEEDTDDDGATDYDEVEEWYAAQPDHGKLSNPRSSIARASNKSLDLNELNADFSSGLSIPFAQHRLLNQRSLTFEAWYKHGSSSASGNILSYTYKGKNALSLQVENGRATAKADLASGSSLVELQLPQNIADGNWHHLAAVRDFDTGTLRLVLDGVMQKEAFVPAGDSFVDNSYDIARTADMDATLVLGDGTLTGLLDEVRIWGRARQISEIGGEQMRLASDNQAVALLAYYRFDDGGKSIEDFCKPFPGLQAEKFALQKTAGLASTWLEDSEGAPVFSDRPGAIPNWWAELYKPVTALPGISEFNGHYYEVVRFAEPGSVKWSEAQQDAIRRGGSLAVISSAKENAFIYSLLNSADRAVWIGLNDNEEEGVFVWEDGSVLDGGAYSNWSSRAVGGTTDEPNNGDANPGQDNFENAVFMVGPTPPNSRLISSYWNDEADEDPFDHVNAYVVEYSNYMNFKQNNLADYDGDGLDNWYEFLSENSPVDVDSNRDGLSDGAEKFGAYPLENLFAQDSNAYLVDKADADTDDDGLTDSQEYVNGTDLDYSRSPLILRELHLEQDSWVTLPNDLRYAALNFTLEAWIRPDSNASGIIIERQIGAGKYNYKFELTTDGLLKLSYDSLNGVISAQSSPLEPIIRDAVTWTHVAVSLARANPGETDRTKPDFHKYKIEFVKNGLDISHDKLTLPELSLPMRWHEGPVHTSIGS